jgi:hypothetical protein
MKKEERNNPKFGITKKRETVQVVRKHIIIIIIIIGLRFNWAPHLIQTQFAFKVY